MIFIVMVLTSSLISMCLSMKDGGCPVESMVMVLIRYLVIATLVTGNTIENVVLVPSNLLLVRFIMVNGKMIVLVRISLSFFLFPLAYLSLLYSSFYFLSHSFYLFHLLLLRLLSFSIQ